MITAGRQWECSFKNYIHIYRNISRISARSVYFRKETKSTSPNGTGISEQTVFISRPPARKRSGVFGKALKPCPALFQHGSYGEVKNVNELDEKWILCPVCGAKTRLRLLQRTVLRDFPLFCPKCKQERIINAQNFRIEIIHQPDAKTQC